MLKQSNASHRTSVPLSPKTRTTKLFIRLARLLPAVLAGLALFVLLQLALLVVAGVYRVQAAPPAGALADRTTGVITVQHTISTTHQMVVFGNGKITNRYLSDNGQNQIDQDGHNSDATTIAILFDQHPRPDVVDVGSDNDFYTTTLITLNDPSIIPGYSEDSYVVYASKALSYQVTQRTLTTDRVYGDWLAMELSIRNMGDIPLTGGKLLFMIDIDVAYLDVDDEGGYDPLLHLVYQTDTYGDVGYAMGVSLLEGDWRGYGVDGKAYLATDSDKINEMIKPRNTIRNGHNDVSWLVADMPVLYTGEETEISFGLCAKTGNSEIAAALNLARCIERIPDRDIDYVPVLGIDKNGPTVAKVGDTVPFTFTITNDDKGDSSPVSLAYISDTIIGPITNSPVISGDSDSFLEKGEVWVYTASYIVPSTVSHTIESTAFVEGRDLDNDIITATDTYSFCVNSCRNDIYLPVILENYEPPICYPYSDDFSISFNYPGKSWEIKDNEYVQLDYTTRLGISPSGKYLIHNKVEELRTVQAPIGPMNRYTVEANVHWSTMGYEYGLTFGQNGGPGSPAYRFVVDSVNGMYRLEYGSDSEGWRCVGPQPRPCWVKSGYINPGFDSDDHFNGLKLECNGPTVELYINGQKLPGNYAVSSCYGRVGLTDQSYHSAGAKAYFDDFRVSCLFGMSSLNVESNSLFSSTSAGLEIHR